jgi:hypothetical protein
MIEKSTSVVLLPYVQTTYGSLNRLLARHNIKCVALPPRKIPILRRPVKNGLGLTTLQLL